MLTFKNDIATATGDVSGKELMPTLVQSAPEEEIAYSIEHGVYKIVPRSRQRSTAGKVIGTRWVDTNKGDAEVPYCRSRLVGRELHIGGTGLSISTRWVLSFAATGPRGNSKTRRCVVIDDFRRAK